MMFKTFLPLLILFTLTSVAAAGVKTDPIETHKVANKETVFLLHGIARTKQSMKKLEKALLQEGYSVVNIDYPSRKHTIAEIADMVFKIVHNVSEKNKGKIHFVCYSMGCLVVRELLAKYDISQVENIVMLGPPNQGSEVADFLKDNFLYKSFYGPAGQELTTAAASKNPSSLLQYSIGIIAGNVCFDPICYFILPKGHDGKVTIESTKLEGMRDHIVLSCSHTFMITNKEAIAQVKYFLKHSRFNH